MDEVKMRGHRYDWLEWFSHSKIKLYKNRDYRGTTTYFAAYVRRAAKRHGYDVSVKAGEGEILIEILGRTEPNPDVHHNRYRSRK